VLPAALPAQQQYPGKYILASLALPGAGELWRGHRTKGEIFLWTDAAIWLTYGGLSIVGNSRLQDSRLFAHRYADASPAVRSDDYYVAVERYWNSDLYNEDVRRDARELYPDDPERQRQYAEQRSYTGDMAWSWGSDSLQWVYRDDRRNARTMLQAAGFVLGGALLNRLVSAIDVAFFTPTRASPTSRWRPAQHIAVEPRLDQPGLAVRYRF
jgi:hypothetical protein